MDGLKSPWQTFVCVGMEHSSRFGDCPGCKSDATRIYKLLNDSLKYSGSLLISEQATKAAVVNKLKECVAATPDDGLCMFLYSGHGGQEYLGGDEPEGADDQDEYLCLYDSHMLDDEIWDIVSKCKGRVFLYFDACHSATMYRSVRSEIVKGAAKTKAKALAWDSADMTRSSGFTFNPKVKARPMSLEASGPSILCWSGCKEAEYSYGSSFGGTLTNAMLDNWKKGLSYDALWGKTYNSVKKDRPDQTPVQTCIGGFPKDREAFK